MSQSLAKQTQDINTNKPIVPIYNFVREREFPTKRDNQLKSAYGIAIMKSYYSCVI